MVVPALRHRSRAALIAVAAIFPCAVAPTAGATTIATYPVPSPGAGLSDITAGPDGNLWFTEEDTDRIGRVTPAGQITEFPVPKHADISDSGPTDIVGGGDGQLWFLNDVDETVDRITTAGTVQQMFFDQIDNGRHISPFPGGGVWETLAASANDDSVRIVRSDGSATELPGQLAGGRAPIATAPDGSAWFADGASALRHVTADGSQVSVPLPPALIADDVRSIAFTPDGTPFYTQYYGGDFPLPPSGGILGTIAGGQAASTDLGGDYLPEHLTLGPDGALWWAEKNGIGRRDPSGAITHASLGAYQASAIAFGSDGALWFVDANANVVGRATPSALFPAAVGAAPPPATPGKKAPPAKRKPAAPSVKLTLPAQRLSAVRSHRALRVSAKLAGPATLSLQATVPAATARKLRFPVAKKAKVATLASAKRRYERAGSATLTLRFGTTARRALARARTLKLTLAATTTASGRSQRTTRKTVTLKR